MDSNQQGDSPEHVGDGSGDVAVLESKDVGTLQHRKQGYLTSTWSPGVYVMTRSCCIAYVKNQARVEAIVYCRPRPIPTGTVTAQPVV